MDDKKRLSQTIAQMVYGKRIVSDSHLPKGKEVIGLREAAKACGVSAATLSRIEAGKPPDIYTFRKICIWLGVSADVLLDIPRR